MTYKTEERTKFFIKTAIRINKTDKQSIGRRMGRCNRIEHDKTEYHQ